MLYEAIGRENFSGACGLMGLITLPFGVFCIPAAAMIYARTESYAGAIHGVVVFLTLDAALLLFARPGTSAWQLADSFDVEGQTNGRFRID